MPPEDHPDHPHPGLAIGLVVAAGFVIAAMDAVGKFLIQSHPFEQVVWGRYVFHTLVVGLWFGAKGGFGFLKPRAPVLQTVRAVAMLLVTLSMYAALRVAPLADATAVMFFAPVLVTALAGLFLGEHVGWRRHAAVVVGFVGVLIVVRPGPGVLRSGILWACAAALFYALYVLMTRKLRGRDEERTTLFHSTLAGSILMSIGAPFFWEPLPPAVWPLLIATGLLGAGGHFLLIKAFHMAPAATLSPFLNAQLVAATLYSVAFFGDPLTLHFLCGASLIVGVGLFIWYREQRRKSKTE